jgi:hypothetical protein
MLAGALPVGWRIVDSVGGQANIIQQHSSTAAARMPQSVIIFVPIGALDDPSHPYGKAQGNLLCLHH